jgi:hypothetical protein
MIVRQEPVRLVGPAFGYNRAGFGWASVCSMAVNFVTVDRETPAPKSDGLPASKYRQAIGFKGLPAGAARRRQDAIRNLLFSQPDPRPPSPHRLPITFKGEWMRRRGAPTLHHSSRRRAGDRSGSLVKKARAGSRPSGPGRSGEQAGNGLQNRHHRARRREHPQAGPRFGSTADDTARGPPPPNQARPSPSLRAPRGPPAEARKWPKSR